MDEDEQPIGSAPGETADADDQSGAVLFTDNGLSKSADVRTPGSVLPTSSSRRRPPAEGERNGYSAFKLPGGMTTQPGAGSRPSSRPSSALRPATPRSGALPPSRGLLSTRGQRPLHRSSAPPSDENGLSLNNGTADSTSSSVCSEAGQ